MTTSELVGRGGAAFPTGRKWAGLAAAAGPKYVICNADESEPGTFKDRKLMEEDPFAILEAMVIAGFAVGANTGYVYIRGEYPLATRRIETAAAARASKAGSARAWVAADSPSTWKCAAVEARTSAAKRPR